MRNLIEKYAKEALEILQVTTKKKLRLDQIIMCNKLSKTMGKAAYDHMGRGKISYWIKISTKIFKRDSEALRNTVYHEVAHIVDHQLNDELAHGPTWADLMIKLGLEPVINATEEEYIECGYRESAKITV